MQVFIIKYTRVVRFILNHKEIRHLHRYCERAGQHANVERIKNGIQRRIDNGRCFKVVDNYDAIENIPGEL